MNIKYTIFFIAFLLLTFSNTTTLFGQGVSINDDNSTPDASAMMDVKSTNKGMLVPRMTSLQRTAITTPATGLLVFDNTTTSFWFYDSSVWIELASGNISGLSDADLDTKIEVEQTVDADEIKFTIAGTEYWGMVGPRLETYNTGNSIFIGEDAGAADDLSNNMNIFTGYQAGYKTTTGSNNLAFGNQSLFENTTGTNNVAQGYQALYQNTTGSNNIGHGYQALYYNITGQRNVGLGYRTLYTNYSGDNNLAMGYQALYDNQSGDNNIGFGYEALYDNRTGNNNVSMGYQALANNSVSSDNIAIGYRALYSNYWQGSNIAIGKNSLSNNEDGSYNVAVGIGALGSNWGGWHNIALGFEASKNSVLASNNIAIGYQANFNSNREDYAIGLGYQALYNNQGNHNIGFGYRALYSNITGLNNIALGYEAGRALIGDASICIGYQAGLTETAGNRLYIENSSSTTPLIYGEFDNDLLRINGTLNINNVYSFPTTDGTSGQVIGTDGAGNLSWGVGTGAFEVTAGVVNPNSNVDETADDFVFGSTQLNDDGNSSHDRRFFFDKSKGAFRAGQTTGTEWDNVGNRSTAFGYNTTATGYQSMAFGSNTTASDYQATAFGVSTVASDNQATAFGNGSIASAQNATAFGYNTVASGYQSLAAGHETHAPSGFETTIGIFSTDYTPNATGSWNADDRVFTIGNGTATGSESDAMVVLKSGFVGLGISTPTYDLHIKQSQNSITNGTGGIALESSSSTAIWQVYNTGSHCSFAQNGTRRAYVQDATGTYIVTSDRNKKKNISPIMNVSDKILKLNPVTYHYKHQADGDKKITGFIAQEVEEIFPDMVAYDEDGNIGMGYAQFGILAIAAVKEQQEVIETQEKKIEQLETRLLKLERALLKD